MNSIGRWFLALSHLKTCLNLRFMCGKWMRWIYFKNHLPGSNECCSGHLWSNTFSPFPVSWDIWSLIILDHDRNHQVMVGIIHYWSHILSDLIWYHYSMPFDSGRIFHDSTLFFWSHILSESSIIITNKNPKKRFFFVRFRGLSQLLTQLFDRRPSRLEGLWSDDAACENSGRPRSKSAVRHQGFFGGTFGGFIFEVPGDLSLMFLIGTLLSEYIYIYMCYC